MSQLFSEIGGHIAVFAAVDLLYQKILADPRISHFFQSVDMESQRRKQRVFLTILLSGRAEFAESYLAGAHRQLVEKAGLNDAHFDAVAEHLAATLRELGVPSGPSDKILQSVEGFRSSVLGRNHESKASETNDIFPAMAHQGDS